MRSFCIHVAGFFLLEESLYTKKRSLRKGDGHPDSMETSSPRGDAHPTTLETNNSSGSLLSNDSGIELKMNGSDSDTELIDITQSEMNDHDDELMMVESDIDTDSDFERANSDTELLIHENGASDTCSNRSKWSKFVKHLIPSCLVRECGPRQCYGRARNSLVDSYGCALVCAEGLKQCGKSHRSKRWTPGEISGQTKQTLKRMCQSTLNFVRLILDRRVFLSTLLYALFAFLTIISNAVHY